MITVHRGEFVLMKEDEPAFLDVEAMRAWINVVHPRRGACQAVEEHWEVWGEDTPKQE